MSGREQKKYYTKANNVSEGSIREEEYIAETLNILEGRKNYMFQEKFHKDAVKSIQNAIDSLALCKYHLSVINNR